MALKGKAKPAPKNSFPDNLWLKSCEFSTSRSTVGGHNPNDLLYVSP